MPMQDNGVQLDQHSAMAKAFATARMRETVAWSREIVGFAQLGACRRLLRTEACFWVRVR